MKTITVKVDRMLATTPQRAYAAWLNPKIPGNAWHEARKVILNPKVDGLFYWYISSTPHYGRFTELKRGQRIRHTWISQYTLGLESKVTVTFKKVGDETRMTLLHTGLPNNADGKGHEGGWTYFLDLFQKKFTTRS